jgi:sigma-B regulation protein RsbU (phosphoserine phosphatase)
MKFRERVLGVMAVVNKQSADGAKIFTAGDLFLLDSVATHGAISLNNIEIYKRQEEQKLVEADMRVASEIQRMLLPDTAPDVANFDLHALNHAAQHVSGDYYDFIPLDESRVGVIIADVSGKAVSGALVMATCRAILRTQCALSNSPASVLVNVQRRLIADLPEDMFITMTYGILDGDARTFKFARAGHDPALWFEAAKNEIVTLVTKGIAVGLSRPEQFEKNLQEREIQLPPGDILVLYTDGITESLDAAENEFGRERLAASVRDCAHETAAEISACVIERLREFTGDDPPHDDRTLIVIKSL